MTESAASAASESQRSGPDAKSAGARRRHRRGLYWAALVLACGAIVATAAHSYRSVEAELTAAAFEQRAAVAGLAASVLAERFDRLADLALSLATRVRFREHVAAGRWPEAAAILGAVPRDFPFVEWLLIADPEGAPRVEVPASPAPPRVAPTLREWFRGASREGRPLVSPVYTRAGEPRIEVFAVAAPIRDGAERTSGILVLEVRAQRLLEWLAPAAATGAKGFVYVLDAAGRTARHSRALERGETVDFAVAPVLEKLRRGESGVEIHRDAFEGRPSVLAFAPVRAHGWGVVVGEPVSSAPVFVAKERQLGRLLLAYGLVLLFLGAAAALVWRIADEHRRAAAERGLRLELERRVAERTAELAAANRELESFSYSVSHDLRAPLRAIDGFARILEEDHAARLDEEGRRVLGVVRENARRMGELIDALLAFSRLGRRALRPEPLDMERLAREAAEEALAADHGAARIEIGALPPAHGDAALLRQVWANLLSNALKFSARREQPRVEVSGRREGAENVYCVRDNGEGFDMRYADKLFGVFQRLHDPGEFPGSGIGLAIVQRVVARHGGRVWAEGRPGEGAAFYFSLPAGGTA